MPARLMLLDTASLYFRAFYGLPDTIVRADGTPVNAVRGLLDMIARLTTDYGATHLIACWDDAWRPQWRVDLLPTYKSHRVAVEVTGATDVEVVPDALEAQIPLIRHVLDLAGVAVVGAAEHEADDVVGTYASHADVPVDVVTGDRDLFQVVDDARQVRVIYTARGMRNLEVVTDGVVVGKYRVLPEQYADYATLRGDASDGLPGVAGIGEKTAASLLLEYGTLESLLAAATDAGSSLSASVRSKLAAAADYLSVAPTVVKIVRWTCPPRRTREPGCGPSSAVRAPNWNALPSSGTWADRSRDCWQHWTSAVDEVRVERWGRPGMAGVTRRRAGTSRS